MKTILIFVSTLDGKVTKWGDPFVRVWSSKDDQHYFNRVWNDTRGGAHIATSFLKEQLIDELWLTIEPKIFGIGGNFVIAEKLDINLQLISCEKVNKQGTLITKYAVKKDKNIKLKE
jgi:riboflavin biosynthesis pyrimidine reductase